MPQAVTHILVPILLLSLIRDKYLKTQDKKHFPLHYILIAGLGGVLPDIDLLFSFIRKYLDITNWNIHHTFTHSLFFPAIFLILYLILGMSKETTKICKVRNHKLKWSIIFLMMAIGSIIHIGLDSLVGEGVHLFYPFSNTDYSINLLGHFSNDIMPSLDGILLVIWLIYLETKHKIADFI